MTNRNSRHFLGKIAHLSAFAASLWLAGCSTSPSLQPPKTFGGEALTALTNVTVIDVLTGERARNSTILVRGTTIAAVGKNLRLPAGTRRIDGRQRFVLPGLWDMHTHHQGSGLDSLRLYLANGVVGTRDMGSDADFILPLRDRIEKNEILGPRIIAAGPILDDPPTDFPWRRRVTTASEARAAVRDLRAKGVDLIKVHDHTPRDAFFAIMDEARKNSLPVAGHVPMSVTMEEAYRSGMMSIEHFANGRSFGSCIKALAYSPDACADQFSEIAATGVWQDPTLVFFLSFPDQLEGQPLPHFKYASDSLLEHVTTNVALTRDKVSEPQRKAMRTIFGIWARAVGDMKKAGVKFVAGCDLMLPPGFCLLDELHAYERSGLSPLEALQTATINPARMLGREDRSGTIGVGKDADLIILDNDPLLSSENLREPSGVMVAGRLFGEKELAEMRRPFRAPQP